MSRKRLGSDKIADIRNLRARGFSIPEISHELNIPKTTVFSHTYNVEILPEFVKHWQIKRGGSKRRQYLKEEQANIEAKSLIGRLTTKEKLLFICALYWAEGNKKDFILSNTDPDLIKVFIDGLRNVLGVNEERFRISIRIYEDMNKDKCLDFWSNLVGIPKEKFLRINVLYGKKKGKLEYGMCRVRVAKGGDLLKKIKAINRNFSEELANIN